MQVGRQRVLGLGLPLGRLSRHRTAAVLLTVVLWSTVAACGGGSPPDQGATGDPPGSRGSTAATGPASPVSGGRRDLVANTAPATTVPSPLPSALGWTMSAEELSLAYAEVMAHHADAITACVRAEGFSQFLYTGPPPPEPSDFEPVPDDDPTLRSEGYGVSAALETWLAGPPSTDAADVDPFLQSLSAEEEDAFAAAFNGCSADALEAYPLPDSPSRAVAELMDEFEHDWLSSPDLAAVWDDWSACIAAEGFRFGRRDDIAAHLDARASPLLDQLDRAAQGAAPIDPDLETAIAELRVEELAIADSDWRCSRRVQLRARIAELRRRAEQAFVDEHLDRIALARADTTD